MAAGVVEAIELHALLTHVAERHRRTEVGRHELSKFSEAPASAHRCVRSAIQRSTFGCVAACVVPSGVGGAGGGAEVAAVVVGGFAFVRAAGGFTAAGANGSSSAMTGSGVMTVFEAVPASPDCMELDSFTAMRTGRLCG